MDTWRWDYLGASGSGRVATPNLDTLASGGVYASEVLSPCPLTTPAHATLLTGWLPLRHGVLDCTSYRLDPSVPTLAEGFRAAGYRTGAFISAEPLDRRFGLTRGFGHYDDGGQAGDAGATWLPPVRDGEATTEAALRWLQSAGSPPAFLWVHYFDPHLPYRPRSSEAARYPKDPYAQQVAFVDGQVGRLLSALRADRGRSWRVVVVGDHGEGLGDHGEREHGMALYRETAHVPLLLWPEPRRPLHRPAPWTLQDLAPTLRDWFGLPAVTGDGVSLFDRGVGVRDLPLLSVLPSLLYGVEPSRGLRRGPYLYLQQGREELFDLGRDPGQSADLSADPRMSALLASLRAACREQIPVAGLQAALRPTLSGTPEEVKRLESLGYVGGGVSSAATLSRVDIRTLLSDQTRIELARESARATGDRTGLRAIYESVLPRYPSSLFILRNLAVERVRAGNPAGAIPLLERAVRLRPEDPAGLLSLGGAYLADKQQEKALVTLEACLKRAPDLPEVHKNLGLLYVERGEGPKAAHHLGRYLELVPDSPEATSIRAYLDRARTRP